MSICGGSPFKGVSDEDYLGNLFSPVNQQYVFLHEMNEDEDSFGLFRADNENNQQHFGAVQKEVDDAEQYMTHSQTDVRINISNNSVSGHCGPGGVNVIDWYSSKLPPPSPSFFEQQSRLEKEEKVGQRYTKALDRIKKNNLSLHNKVFDQSSCKFVDASAFSEKSRVMTVAHDSNLFVEKGNHMGKMEAEMDLLLYQVENGSTFDAGKSV